MAASNVLSSLTWIIDKAKFLSVLNSSFLCKDSLSGCVLSENVDSVFHGINQLNYWKRKLSPSIDNRTVLMACLGPSGLLRPDIHLIYEQAELITGKESIISVYYSENTNIIGLNFTSAEAAVSVRQGVATVGGALVCHIEQLPPNTYEVRVLWAPAFCPISIITQLFSSYTTEVNLSFETVNVTEGRQLPSNIATGRLTLKDNFSIDNLPHITKLPDASGRYVLIVLKDRPPICFRCREVGHVRKQCKLQLCAKCKTRHSRELPCLKPSYAMMLSQSQLPPLLGFRKSVLPVDNSTNAYGVVNQQLPNSSFETNSSGLLPCTTEIINKFNGCLPLSLMDPPDPAITTSDSTDNSLPNETSVSINNFSNSPFISHEIPLYTPDVDGHDEFKLVTRRVTRSMHKKARATTVKNRDSLKFVPLPVSSAFSNLSDEVDMMDDADLDKTENSYTENVNLEEDTHVDGTSRRSRLPSQSDGADGLISTPVEGVLGDEFILGDAKADIGIATFDNDLTVTSAAEDCNHRKENSLHSTTASATFEQDVIIPIVIKRPVFPVHIRCVFCRGTNLITEVPWQDVRCSLCPRYFCFDPDALVLQSRW